MKRRIMALGLALTLSVGTLAGCATKDTSINTTKPAEPQAAAPAKLVEIEYWNVFTGPDGKGMQNLVEQFNKEFDGKIKVTVQSLPAGEYYDKIVTAVASGNAPEVGIMHVDNVKKFAAKGILQPLDDDLKALGIKGENYLTPAWVGGQYQGHQYSVPLDVHPLALYYNIDLLNKAGFKEPPKTPDEFIAMAKAATKDGNWGYMLPVGWPSSQIFDAALYQNGGTLYSADGQKPVYNSAEGVKAMQWLKDLVYKEKVSPENVPVDGGVTAFRQGKLLFTIDGIWMMQGFKDQAGLNFGVAPVQSILGTQKKAVWAGSHQFVLYKMKKNDEAKRKAALTFVDWIGKHSVEWAKWGQIPAHNEARNSADFKALKEQSILAQQVDSVIFVEGKDNPWAPAGFDTIGEQLNLIFTNKIDTKAGLDKAVENALKALESAKAGG